MLMRTVMIRLQDFNIGDGSIVTTTTSCFLSKRRRLESVSSCHPFHRHLSLKDHTALAEVENRLFDGNGQPYVHETPQGTMLFEGGAPYEQNLYSSCIPTMTLVSQTRRLRSLELLWEAERQLLRDQLENEQRAHWATREDAAMASRQLRVQNAAFESENIRLHRALAHTSQFSPQLYMDPPCPHFESESASSSQFATASSSSAST
ncbi:TMV resistance protein N-like [Fagus crenata]